MLRAVAAIRMVRIPRGKTGRPQMKNLLLATVITCARFIVPTYAADLTGETLSYACAGNVPDLPREKNTEEYAKYCNAYINAWLSHQETTTFCSPKITVEEMSVVFFDYLATHIEPRKLPAAEALMLAFKDKWPCR